MAFENPDDDRLRALLQRVQTIAVVGFSPKKERASHGVALAMQRFGYRIIPVRPALAEGLGEKAYPDLAAIPDRGRIDLVDVFRAPEHVDAIADACIDLQLPALWLQQGVVNEPAAARAAAAGMTVVMDRCVYQEYLRLFGAGPRSGP
ncbi:MAG: CoA-binding protein [Chromatiales bacterium]|nr:CoA-binding protein [Chromatiales bacterium]